MINQIYTIDINELEIELKQIEDRKKKIDFLIMSLEQSKQNQKQQEIEVKEDQPKYMQIFTNFKKNNLNRRENTNFKKLISDLLEEDLTNSQAESIISQAFKSKDEFLQQIEDQQFEKIYFAILFYNKQRHQQEMLKKSEKDEHKEEQQDFQTFGQDKSVLATERSKNQKSRSCSPLINPKQLIKEELKQNNVNKIKLFQKINDSQNKSKKENKLKNKKKIKEKKSRNTNQNKTSVRKISQKVNKDQRRFSSLMGKDLKQSKNKSFNVKSSNKNFTSLKSNNKKTIYFDYLKNATEQKNCSRIDRESQHFQEKIQIKAQENKKEITTNPNSSRNEHKIKNELQIDKNQKTDLDKKRKKPDLNCSIKKKSQSFFKRNTNKSQQRKNFSVKKMVKDTIEKSPFNSKQQYLPQTQSKMKTSNFSRAKFHTLKAPSIEIKEETPQTVRETGLHKPNQSQNHFFEQSLRASQNKDNSRLSQSFV